jgi:hypothetical protein
MISPARMNLNTGGNRVGRWSSVRMSALGHKQTYAPQQAMSALHPIATAKADMPHMVMSALPPKADMCGALAHVCFGPIADIAARHEFLDGRRTAAAINLALRNAGLI